jgi:hypothetical protein
MREASRVAREVPFSVPLERERLRGFLDALVRSGEDGGRSLIVDYKTGQGADRGDEELRGDYSLQAECYALAALADDAADIEVVFVRVEDLDGQGRAREVRFQWSAGDERVLRAGIEERMAQISRGVFEPLKRFDPGTCANCAAVEVLCPVKTPARGKGRP